MKSNLLIKSTIFTAVVAAMTGCSDVEKGYDPGFGESKSQQVTFSDERLVAAFDEVSGEQTIDLLQGAMVGGEALSTFTGAVFIKNIEFTEPESFATPQGDSNTISSHRISPFTVTGTNLIVNTDLFDESLRMCDTSDNRGAQDNDGNPIGDGILDFPSAVTYTVTYQVDNGYEGEAAVRELQLTINSINDPVTEVVASNLELPAGGEAQFVASTLPAYACNSNLVYTIEDSSVLSSDNDGMVTGLSTGTTLVTVTSEENAELSASAEVTVTTAFSLAIQNEDLDPNLGTPTGKKVVPTCVAVGIDVQPFILNGELNGDYGYNWASSNAADMPAGNHMSNGFGEFGVIEVGNTAGAVSVIDVELASGETGATPISSVASKSVELTSAVNEMCEPGTSLHAAGFNTDFNLDVAGAPYKGNMAAVAASTDAVKTGGTSVQITAGSATLTVDGTDVPYTRVGQEVWNKQRQWASWNYGRGLESVGKTYTYSVWAKLEAVPSAPVTLRHVIVPWNFEGELDTTQSGFLQRYVEGGAAIFSATLDSTTDWQYIEFTLDETGEREFTIPETWNAVTDVFALWEIHNLPSGATLLLDEYGVIHTNKM